MTSAASSRPFAPRAAVDRAVAFWRAQPLRVQALLLAAVAAVVIGIAESLVWSRLSKENAALARRIELGRRELGALQQVAEQSAAARRAEQARTAAARAELARLDASVRDALARTVDPSDVPDRLGRLMPRAGPLRASGLSSEPPQPLDGGSLFRHPFELQLEGDWPSLVAHVRTLEAELASVQWRGIDVTTTDWPMLRGRLEVFTLSGQRVWIRL